MTDLASRNFWTRYVPFWNPKSPIPFVEEQFQTYRIGGRLVRSMLSSFELSLIFALAKDHWSGRGAIIDTGCLYGLTTRCFADGIKQNERVEELRKADSIYAYDLFLLEDYDFYSSGSPTTQSGSLFPDFLRLNQDHLGYIVPCPGDFLKMRWGEKPIEILMVDVAKSWDLNEAVVRRFFPRLIPGTSIVVQQDYMNWYEYWTVIAMEYFADKFELLQVLYGCSAVFRCAAPFEPCDIAIDLRRLPSSEKIRLFDAAISRLPDAVGGAMACARANMLIDEGLFDMAAATLDGITEAQVTTDPILDLSGIVQTNRNLVFEKLRAIKTRTQ